MNGMVAAPAAMVVPLTPVPQKRSALYGMMLTIFGVHNRRHASFCAFHGCHVFLLVARCCWGLHSVRAQPPSPGCVGPHLLFLLAVVRSLYTFPCCGAPALQRLASHLKACATR